jgi:glucokinase
MSDGFPRLLGDIGGTNARWAWQPDAAAPPQDVRVLPTADSPTIADSAQRYLIASGHRGPAAAAIGIATAVTGDLVRMTNHPWEFSIDALREELGVARCLVINDFTALAMSLPALGSGDLRPLGGGQAVAGAPLALLGAGTGLGVSGLLTVPRGGVLPISGEGGHVSLAATDEEEAALLALLRRRFGHVSAERVLSGPGLVNLYEALCALHGRAPSTALQPAALGDAAIAGHDALAVRTLRLFTAFLGNVAGNLALTLGARGGVYLGGGIVPRFGAAFDEALFRRRFEDKGRFRDYLAAIPCWVITAAAPALVGASRALDALHVPSR